MRTTQYILWLFIIAVVFSKNVLIAQTDMTELRRQLIEEIDRRLEQVRQELIEEVDKRLEKLSPLKDKLKEFENPLKDKLKEFENPLKDKLKEFEKKIKDWEKFLEKPLENPENQKALDDFLKSSREYLESLQNDPELAKRWKETLECLKQKMKKNLGKGELPEELEKLLKDILNFKKAKKEQLLEKEQNQTWKDSLNSEKETKPYLGIVVIPIPKVLREKEDIPPGTGLLITQVMENSPADRAGITKWDILLSINGQEITSLKDISLILNQYKQGESVNILLVSSGKKRDVCIILENRQK